MTLFKDIALGIRSYYQAHQFIVKHRLWVFLLIPGLINLVLFSIMGYYAWQYSSEVTDWFFEWIGFNGSSENWEMAKGIIKVVLLIIIRALMLLTYLAVYKYIVLILMSPVMAYLSEKVETILTGKAYDFQVKRFIRDVTRGILLAIRNAIIELLLVLVLYMIAFIPLVGFISPILIFIVESFFYGFSMIDYYNERERMSIGGSTHFIFKHFGLATANGAVFLGVLMVPLIGIFVAPTYSVVAATIATHQVKTGIVAKNG